MEEMPQAAHILAMLVFEINLHHFFPCPFRATLNCKLLLFRSFGTSSHLSCPSCVSNAHVNTVFSVYTTSDFDYHQFFSQLNCVISIIDITYLSLTLHVLSRLFLLFPILTFTLNTQVSHTV